MTRKHRPNVNQHVKCCGCGNTFAFSDRFHLHHTAATEPEVTDNLHVPAAGPDLLLDMFHDRRKAGFETSLDQSLRPGDMVKLCFLVTDRKGLWLPRDLRPIPKQYESEAMWVRITDVEGRGAHTTYQGELWDVPMLISPEKLRIGSPVTFEARHVHSHE